jgi:hypothetical protein
MDHISNWKKIALPTRMELSHFLDEPVSEENKFPLSHKHFDALLSPTLHDPCRQEDLELIFRLSETQKCPTLDTFFYNAVFKGPPPDSGTESAFIVFWDRNVREILEVLVPQGNSIRNTSHNTSTRASRPDYGFLLNNVCAFRGEEKSPSNNEDPKAELSEKLVWTYGRAPYVLGEP